MKTSVIEWIKITDRKPKDREYVLGVIETNSPRKGDTLVLAMHYLKKTNGEEVFIDADDIERNENTKEKIIYWAKLPDFQL